MLEVFRAKPVKAEPDVRNRISLHRADMSNFKPNESFWLIIVPYRAFQALTEQNDIQNCLRCV
jgi:hypothetical protein